MTDSSFMGRANLEQGLNNPTFDAILSNPKIESNIQVSRANILEGFDVLDTEKLKKENVVLNHLLDMINNNPDLVRKLKALPIVISDGSSESAVIKIIQDTAPYSMSVFQKQIENRIAKNLQLINSNN